MNINENRKNWNDFVSIYTFRKIKPSSHLSKDMAPKIGLKSAKECPPNTASTIAVASNADKGTFSKT